MKVSLNWVKEYTGIKIPTDQLVEKIGAQLGAVEEVIDFGARYKGIVVVSVIKCSKHPNADKLSICLVDDNNVTPDVQRNDQGLVQVVCGAPNVKAGMMAVWLPPESTVPATIGKAPLVLEAREIRGQMSNGMLGSAHELGLNDDHSGIMEISEKVDPGAAFAPLFKLDDIIIDIENKMFTHRPDCFGILGVAREIAGICHQPFHSPDWYLRVIRSLVFPASDNLPLVVENRLPELVPHFMAIVLKNVHTAPSPVWLQSYLSRIGIKPISNVVDITNYLMFLTGQPLHAYDYDKVYSLSPSGSPATLVIRHPEDGETITLLNGKTITPRREAIMIASATKLIGVGGVMGGSDTEVDERTKNIIIEVASFDMYSIRRTSMEHGLFTEAVTRFNKGQSPLQNDKVLSKAVEMTAELGEGHVAGRLIDDKHVDDDTLPHVTVGRTFINDRLGLDLPVEEMAVLLRNVEFLVEVNNDDLTVTAPFWRTDIEIPEDIVEEVGRLYGFDHLPLVLPKRDITPADKNTHLEFKSRVRNILSNAGANEVLTYSFVHGNLLDRAGQDKGSAYQLSNAISPDLQYMRLSLTPSLLDKVHPNIKAGNEEFALYEIGKSHGKQFIDGDGLPKESELLAFVVAATDKSQSAKSGTAYYQARAYLDLLAKRLGLTLSYAVIQNAQDNPVSRPFDHSRSASITVSGSETVIGIIGEYRQDVLQKLKLPRHTAGFELYIDVLESSLPQKHAYRPLSRYPKVLQDVSLRVPAYVAYFDVLMTLVWALPDVAPRHTKADIQPIDIYQDPDHHDKKTFTFRLTIASQDRTLTSEEVSAMLDRLAAKARDELAAERI